MEYKEIKFYIVLAGGANWYEVIAHKLREKSSLLPFIQTLDTSNEGSTSLAQPFDCSKLSECIGSINLCNTMCQLMWHHVSTYVTPCVGLWDTMCRPMWHHVSAYVTPCVNLCDTMCQPMWHHVSAYVTPCVNLCDTMCQPMWNCHCHCCHHLILLLVLFYINLLVAHIWFIQLVSNQADLTWKKFWLIAPVLFKDMVFTYSCKL